MSIFATLSQTELFQNNRQFGMMRTSRGPGFNDPNSKERSLMNSACDSAAALHTRVHHQRCKGFERKQIQKNEAKERERKKQLELINTKPINLKPYYKKEVNKYFNSLSKE